MKYYIPVNGFVEVDATTEDEAYKVARENVKGLTDFDLGDAILLDDE